MSAGNSPRPHRPALFADLTELIDAAGGTAPASRSEIAAATAELLVQAGRSPGDQARFVALADQVGLDTLAALWRDADPVSLPGALWALYLLRQWCRASGEEVARLWRAGEGLAPADAVVAGLPDYADAAAAEVFGDTVLAGVYQGDLAVALERAAAFFRVIAAGRRALGDSELGDSELGETSQAVADGDIVDGDIADGDLAERNERVARALGIAATRWRAGTLH